MSFAEQIALTPPLARDAFRRAAQAAGAELCEYTHPDRGPRSERLTTDVAWFGRRDAQRLLILNSGTHGVEGLCGSNCQTSWILEGGPRALPHDTAVIVVHWINPYGVAWQRRQCEGNVDLNRNFIDHTAGRYPPNPLYDRIHPWLVSPRLPAEARARADRELEALRSEAGSRPYAAAILVGQYTQPDGLFYGGRRPVWSNATFRRILAEHCGAARSIAFLEYHTGLGPFGYGMLVTMHPPRSQPLRRAGAWYGRSLCASLDNIERGTVTDDMPIATGFLAGAVEERFPSAAVTAVALEFGTFPLDEMTALFREDAWLHAHGDPSSPEGRALRQRVEDFFYPRSADWLEMVAMRSRQVVRQALQGLAAEPVGNP